MSQVSAKQGTTATSSVTQQPKGRQRGMASTNRPSNGPTDAQSNKLPRPIQFKALSVYNSIMGIFAKRESKEHTFNEFFAECESICNNKSNDKWVAKEDSVNLIKGYKACLKKILEYGYEELLDDTDAYKEYIDTLRQFLVEQVMKVIYKNGMWEGDSDEAPEPVFVSLMQYDKKNIAEYKNKEGKKFWACKGKVLCMARVELGYICDMYWEKEQLVECLTKHCKTIELKGFPLKHTKFFNDRKSISEFDEYQLVFITKTIAEDGEEQEYYEPAFYICTHSNDVVNMVIDENDKELADTFLSYILAYKTKVVGYEQKRKVQNGEGGGKSVRTAYDDVFDIIQETKE